MDNSKTRPATSRYFPHLGTIAAVLARCAAEGYLLVEGSDLRVDHDEIRVSIKKPLAT